VRSNPGRHPILLLGGLAAALSLFLLSASPAGAQENSLGSFYGEKNVQYTRVRLMPYMLPDSGYGGEVLFGFHTMSQRKDFYGYSYFYGVSLGGGGAAWQESEPGTLDERDFGEGYGILNFEGFFYSDVESEARPYIGAWLGLGYGTYWIDQIDDEPELFAGPSEVYSAGIELGTHLKLGYKYWLMLGAGADLMVFTMGDETELSCPAYLSVGISRWRGPIP